MHKMLIGGVFAVLVAATSARAESSQLERQRQQLHAIDVAGKSRSERCLSQTDSKVEALCIALFNVGMAQQKLSVERLDLVITIEALGDLPNASLMTALEQADQKKPFFEVVETAFGKDWQSSMPKNE